MNDDDFQLHLGKIEGRAKRIADEMPLGEVAQTLVDGLHAKDDKTMQNKLRNLVAITEDFMPNEEQGRLITERVLLVLRQRVERDAADRVGELIDTFTATLPDICATAAKALPPAVARDILTMPTWLAELNDGLMENLRKQSASYGMPIPPQTMKQVTAASMAALRKSLTDKAAEKK